MQDITDLSALALSSAIADRRQLRRKLTFWRVAAILVATTVLVVALAVLMPRFGIRSAPHPRRAIDVSTLLAQSDPDAAGHPRPRAPGVAPAA